MADPASNLTLPAFWVCGDTRAELFKWDVDVKPATPLWSWDSTTAAGLPDDRRVLFESLDEVKPITLPPASAPLQPASGNSFAGESYVIATASRGGVALLRRSDGAAVFTFPLPNAHSAELLPGGWIAMAGSIGSDKLLIQHISAGVNALEARTEYPLRHGHGAVFEPAQGRLWVCGASTVRVYHVESNAADFSCRRICDIELPDPHAHDLVADPHNGCLIITTGPGVFKIDTTTFEVTPYAPLAKMRDVKGVSVEAASGAIAFIQGEGESWWSEQANVMLPDGGRFQQKFPGRRLYKVRWDQPCWLK